MNPLQITITIILVLLGVTFGITYLVRAKYYQKIDLLDQEKKRRAEKSTL